MWTDEIVEQIHHIREEYAKSFNDDLDAIFSDLRTKEAASGRKVVTLARKPDLESRWSRRADDSHGAAKLAHHSP